MVQLKEGGGARGSRNCIGSNNSSASGGNTDKSNISVIGRGGAAGRVAGRVAVAGADVSGRNWEGTNGEKLVVDLGGRKGEGAGVGMGAGAGVGEGGGESRGRRPLSE